MAAKKKWIIAGVISAAAVGLGLWGVGSFVSSRLQAGSAGVETVTVGTEVIETTVVGSGTLAYSDAEAVSLPSGVEVTSVFYETGQRVERGDLLAAVDTGSLELLMSDTYDEIADVDAKLRETSAEPESTVVTAPIAGRVQSIYASSGASVLETIAAHGSLMIISPDGRLAASVESEILPKTGDEVQVVLPDGTEKKAAVENVRQGGFTAAFTDKALEAGTAVEVRAADGSPLGSGQLEAVDAVAVVGPAGTVEDIMVGPGAEVRTGARLLSVRASSPPAAYQELDRQRQTLTDRYDTLAELHEHGGLIAPVSGVITSCSVSEGTAPPDGSAVSGLPDGLGSLPAGLLDAMGMHRAGSGGAAVQKLTVRSSPRVLHEEAVPEESETESDPEPAVPEPDESEPLEPATTAPGQTEPPPAPPAAPREIPRLTVPLVPPIPGLPLQHDIELLPLCTGEVSWDPADVQAQFSTKYALTGELHTLDGFCFASDCTLSILCGEVTSCSVSEDQTTVHFTASYEKTPDALSAPDIDWDKIRELLGIDSVDLNSLLQMVASGLLPSGSLGALGGDLSGLLGGSGLDFGALAGLDPSALSGLDPSILSGLDPATLAALQSGNLAGLDPAALAGSTAGSSVSAYTIAAENSMQLLIQVSQLDVLSVDPGMPCEITVDALEGETFTGTVTDVAGTNNSNGTYTAKITLSKTPQMRSGMSASAVITTSTTDSALTLPAAAIQEDGNRVFVYTSYDAASGTYGGEKDIETGVSDGSSVEILSGLQDGETVYYAAPSPLERMMDAMGGPARTETSGDGSGNDEGPVQITIDQEH